MDNVQPKKGILNSSFFSVPRIPAGTASGITGVSVTFF